MVLCLYSSRTTLWTFPTGPGEQMADGMPPVSPSSLATFPQLPICFDADLDAGTAVRTAHLHSPKAIIVIPGAVVPPNLTVSLPTALPAAIPGLFSVFRMRVLPVGENPLLACLGASQGALACQGRVRQGNQGRVVPHTTLLSFPPAFIIPLKTILTQPHQKLLQNRRTGTYTSVPHDTQLRILVNSSNRHEREECSHWIEWGRFISTTIQAVV